MIIKSISIEKFRAFENVSFDLGKRITVIAGRNATQKTTVLGMLGQPFTISSKQHPMYGCKTIDGYDFRSQFREKFKISPEHDKVGDHRWTLLFHNNISGISQYCVESISRTQKDKTPTLRFWNAKSRAKGSGYVQIPVYFLSLSRLFPIGESGKTKSNDLDLSEDEIDYCLRHYREILSIHQTPGTPSVGLEKGTVSRTFAGVSDDVHDIFTNSTGESNVMRIVLAVLSFKRLKNKYNGDYKGGLLFIDESDATLYGYSQEQLVKYLYAAAEENNLQIVFTTHSTVILNAVSKLQQDELKTAGRNRPYYGYNCGIVYLEPYYAQGKRLISAKNISTRRGLHEILDDIFLLSYIPSEKISVYCEDMRAQGFLRALLSNVKNTDDYLEYIDINLGWTNYYQLCCEKKIKEFTNNLIVLDADVPHDSGYASKEDKINKADNILFLPIEIEKGLFIFLKNTILFEKFQNYISDKCALSYDVCFSNWPLEPKKYNIDDFKKWYHHIEECLKDETILFNFWCKENQDEVRVFNENFIKKFNALAESRGLDTLDSLDSNIVDEMD